MAIYDGEETLLDYVLMDIPDGYHTFITNASGQQVSIEVEFVNILGSTSYTTSPTLGDNVADSRMLILKYHGNLTVEAGVTLRPQVRKRGMFLCVLGNLINNGTISMTARGAIAAGQNVFIAKNADGENVLVPAVGASGGTRGSHPANGTQHGQRGVDGINGQSGGGGGGSGGYGTGGNGSAGTSYSGGTGGGGGGYDNRTGSAGSSNGGRGGNASCSRTAVGGGAGNPGGTGGCGGGTGGTGTGGLLILIVLGDLFNTGAIQSNGSNGGAGGHIHGGGSGGGSVNLLTAGVLNNTGTITASGGSSPGGARGGNGSIRSFFIEWVNVSLPYSDTQVILRDGRIDVDFSITVVDTFLFGDVLPTYRIFLMQDLTEIPLKELTSFDKFEEDIIVIHPSLFHNDREFDFVVQVTLRDLRYEKKFKVKIFNSTPKINAKMKGLNLNAEIVDLDGDCIKYRVLLNGTQIIPLEKDTLYSECKESFIKYSRTFFSNEVKIGEVNEVTIIGVDSYGGESKETITFIGEYSGLMFSDLNDDFYSTDMGEILKYLLTETMMAGTSSLVYPIKLINKYPFKVENIRLFTNVKDLQGVLIQFSEEEVPFIAKTDLTFNMELDYEDEIIFYVRVSSDPSTMGGGVFDIYVKADPV